MPCPLERPSEDSSYGAAFAVVLGAVSWLCVALLVVGCRRAAARARDRDRALAELRASVGKIATAAQAGTVGDAAAAEYAFAIIARRAHECTLALDDLLDSETVSSATRS
jgi:hypothetical protein